ncbi:CRISPR system precrRNA processing endoribonuclease RAMP protein Cas6 [Nocardiopsis valliformis]|uniref:CRISPR system precrRNA processing endoribonuclease RAMP protein Cas6 n=1 Tax=Nocardiopsis valliformis TaxID=239974 RepID=UPI000349A1CE|nr:CRISPR system precrRNA processing endoribonuclease RAMP protein Cas6 [Nocardiopsis valliformis]
MPTQWSLSLDPPPPPSGVLPSHLHALACALLESSSDDHTAQAKPFTASLAGRQLTLSWLNEPTEPDLGERIINPVRLGPHTATASLAEQRFEAYARMAAAPPAHKVAVSFLTATYVNQAGNQLPLPVPELLLGGLTRRWETFSPQPLPASAVTEVVESAHVSRHSIRTLAAGSGPSQRTGFVGNAVFGLPTRASRQAQRAFAALWLFASFAGVGAQTTHGLGHVQVRMNQEAAPRSGPRTAHSPALSERTS